MLSCFDDHPTDGFGSGVFEKFGIDIVFALMMIEDDLLAGAVSNHVGHIAQLNPRTCVKDHV